MIRLFYKEAGTFTVSNARTGQPVMIHNFDQPEAWFTVPAMRIMNDGIGTIHIILAVTDHGSPRLTRYQRVIVKVVKDITQENRFRLSEQACDGVLSIYDKRGQ